MIFVTGDCRADFRKLNTKYFPDQVALTRNDYVIVCGDFGYWDGSKQNKHEIGLVSQRNFTTLFVDGNHENYVSTEEGFLGLNELPVTEWHCGKVNIIPGTDNVIHLKRGEVFDLDGVKILAMGGAASHDISDGIIPYSKNWKKVAHDWDRMGKYYYRVEGVSWWKEENITEEDYENAMKNIREKTENNHVDFVFSHCCPSSTLKIFAGDYEMPDNNTDYLERIKQEIDYKYWFFGHYHMDQKITDKDILLYNEVVKIWDAEDS